MAFCASSGVLISTNPNPLLRPVSRSLMTSADETVPCSPNIFSNSEAVME
jgi:hypothetical protein